MSEPEFDLCGTDVDERESSRKRKVQLWITIDGIGEKGEYNLEVKFIVLIVS